MTSSTKIPQALLETSQINLSELSDDVLDLLLQNHASFTIRAVDEMKDAVKRVEHRIEEMGMTCRVYTEYRAAAVGASMLFAFVGVASLATVAAHNILTWDPDYELAKSVAKNTLTVTYKKAVKSGTVIDASTF